MIYLVMVIGGIVGFWLIMDMIAEREPALGPLNRVLRARRYGGGRG